MILMNSPDLDKDQKILETVNPKIKTGNVIGFLGCGQERLTISLVFSDESNDHFCIIFYKRFSISI